MPERSAGRVRWSTAGGWDLTPVQKTTRTRRAAPPTDTLVEQLLGTQRFELVQAFTAAPSPRRGVSAAPVVDLMVDSPPGELHVLVVRRPSGAITFHVPVHTESAASRATSRFSVPLAPGGDPSQRRGLVSLAAGIFVLKVAGLIAGKTVPVLARLWETAAWKLLQREEGWLRVSPQDLAAGSLPRLADFGDLAAPPERNLLLIHGTFSHAAAAFPELGSTPGASGQSFFQALAPVYGDRIFAFDHFTVSRTPEENARALLEALPDRPSIFDVITHSRGGLVLRYLAERRDRFGKMAERFQLGRAVLVASPNEGTPLASPQRFETFLGWLGNLVDYLPDGPPFALGFVSQGLAWLAQRIAGAIPGIAAMDSAGPVVAELQDQPGPAPGAYSALVSNFEPDANLLQRMVDAGVDAFFATANDLVVPTEGGWRVDPGTGPVVPGERIGCFGRSGNILTEGNGAVHHTNFFSRPESIDFLVRALRGESQPLAPVDPNQDLAFRGRRGAVAVTPAPGQPPAHAPEMPVRLAPAGRLDSSFEDVFHLSILEESRSTGSNRTRSATLLATFRNAKVLDRIETGGGEAGRRWRRIFQVQRGIRNFIEGEPGAPDLPHGKQLVQFGGWLFAALFPGEVRRLYDVARSVQRSSRLNLVLTSRVDWIADNPWEFAYDPDRKTFLAVEEVNFVRNALTAIPADRLPKSRRLRILVVVAQPLGTAHLSVEEEEEAVKAGFRRLIDDGLADVDILQNAAPARLHRVLEAGERYDVIHFIGHGTFENGAGYLVFEDEQQRMQKLEADVFRQIVCRRDVRLVFLNACETGQGGVADFNRGLAPALIAGGVPAVVANQYSVLDISATAFARHFYWSLAQGRSLGDAATEARIAVNYAIAGEAIDWAIPVVYARNPAEALCEPRAAADVKDDARKAVLRARRAPPSGKIRVALWDVHRMIPSLPQIAEAMTGSQERFAFEPVSIAAPMGTWRREKSKESGEVAYLRAEKVAQRLEGKPAELGVQRLICLTNLPLRDRDTLELYGWEDAGEQIAIFSMFGFIDQLRPPELTMQRMIANGAAGFLAGLSCHKRGRKFCPLYYNDERDIRAVAGALKLCPACQKTLRADRGLREAIEKLLLL